MPVYTIVCPDCGNRAQSFVFAGAKIPDVWVCSKCGGDQAAPSDEEPPRAHPWESEHGRGCPCCG